MRRLLALLFLALPVHAWAQSGAFIQYQSNSGGSVATIQSPTSPFAIKLLEPAPGAATTALAGAGAGSVDNGAHIVKVTCYSANGETSGGTASNSTTVADKSTNGKIALTSIPLCSSTVTGRKVYMSTVAGSYFLLSNGTLADNTTTTLTANDSDATLAASTALPSSNTEWDTRFSCFATAGTPNTTGCTVPTGTTTVPGIGFAAAPTSGFTYETNQIDWIVGGVRKGWVDNNGALTMTSLALAGQSFASSGGSAVWQLGAANAASPVAQTLQAQGTTANDTAGGGFTLRPGLGKGNGAGASAQIHRNIMTSSGSTSQAQVSAVVPCESKTLSNTTATLTTLATITTTNNSAGGGKATLTVTCSDGTNFDADTVDATWSWVNKAGTVTVSTPTITASSATNNSGSCTTAFTITATGAVVNLNTTPAFTTIVPTTTTGYLTVSNNGPASVACQ